MTIKEKADVLKYFEEMACDKHLPTSTFGNVPDLDGDAIWYNHRVYLVNYLENYVTRPKLRYRLKILFMSIKYRYIEMRRNMLLKSLQKRISNSFKKTKNKEYQ